MGGSSSSHQPCPATQFFCTKWSRALYQLTLRAIPFATESFGLCTVRWTPLTYRSDLSASGLTLVQRAWVRRGGIGAIAARPFGRWLGQLLWLDCGLSVARHSEPRHRQCGAFPKRRGQSLGVSVVLSDRLAG